MDSEPLVSINVTIFVPLITFWFNVDPYKLTYTRNKILLNSNFFVWRAAIILFYGTQASFLWKLYHAMHVA